MGKIILKPTTPVADCKIMSTLRGVTRSVAADISCVVVCAGGCDPKCGSIAKGTCVSERRYQREG